MARILSRALYVDQLTPTHVSLVDFCHPSHDVECCLSFPKKWNLSRFLDALGRQPHLSLLHEAFDNMIQRLGEVVPDVGRDTAGDATALNARRKKEKLAAEEKQEGLPQASGGRKEYTDDDMSKVLHLIEFKNDKINNWIQTGPAQTA